MKKTRFIRLIAILVLGFVFVGCAPTETETPTVVEPTEAPTEVPTEEPMMEPSVSVEDQEVMEGTVTVPEVVSAGPGWIVIHADDDGPGPVIGYTAVSEGTNTDVQVEIDTEAATETLYAMLHEDVGEEGTYEFPDSDPPVKVDDQVVVKPFTVEMAMMMQPSVTVEDQEVMDGTVTVAEVVSEGPGWIVIHADDDGPGPVIGYTAVSAGQNADVQVEIDTEAATETLYAMLHVDAGEEGTYEFPGDDAPVTVDGEIVVKPFTVEMEEMGAMGMEEMANVAVVDSAFEPEEMTVSVGTTVVWEHEGSLPHTVTSDDDIFDSGSMSSGDTFEYTFEEAGTFPYYCEFHGGPGGSGMAGVITVTEE